MRRFRAISLAACIAAAFITPAAAQSVNGEVVRVDAERQRITLRHGRIPNLDMDEMTMVFRVANPAMLQQVREGDRVRFDADRVNGNITVTRIQRAR